MTPKKILLIGDCNHQLLIAFLRSFKKYAHVDFHAFSITKVKSDNEEHYKQINYARSFSSVYKFKQLRKLFYAFEIISHFKKLNTKFSFSHIHFARIQYLFIWPLIRSKSDKIAVSVWGSEFLRSSRFKRYLLGLMYKRADVVHCSNEALRQSIINYYKISPSRVKTIPFFLENLINIDAVKESLREIKSEFKWDVNKLQMVIGYNYNEGQQHLKIIDELLKLEPNALNSIELVFPLTYGSNINYRENVEQKALKISTTSFFYRTFLPDVEVSKMRIAGDVFINLQTTDQFSGSFVEALYAGNIVITGSWLPYKVLKDAGVYFIEIDTISELNNAINTIIVNHDEIVIKAKENHTILKKMFDEGHLAQEWSELYKINIESN